MSQRVTGAGEAAPTNLAPSKSRFDGIEVECDGAILDTSWNDSSVATSEGSRLVRQIGALSITPADVSQHERRGRVGIVSVEADRFELWTWPGRDTASALPGRIHRGEGR